MMSKRIRFIVIIVACALAGIFLFQGYWLYNSYRLSTQQFDREVMEVMRHLERSHALADMEAMGFFSDSAGQHDRERMMKTVDFLLSGPHVPYGRPVSKRFTDRKLITESRVTFTYRDDTVDIGRRIHLDSVMKFRTFFGDSLKLIRANKDGELVALHTAYRYTNNDFAEFATPLIHEIDSLLEASGIGAAFSVRLSNLNVKGDEYVSDSASFDRQPVRIGREAKIGLLRPYRLTLAIGNDIVYILKNMLWVLMASLVIVGITIWAFVAMLRTIFQQKRLSDIKNDFINNMTHEFKTPIATVSLAVEAMQHFDVMSRPEQAKEYLNICQHELKRISVMVEKVLKMAVFERMDLKLSLQKTDFGKLVHDVIENMRPQWEKKAAKLSVQGLGSHAEAMIDRDHIANVVYNLIDNSLKYTDKRPEIAVSFGTTDDGRLRFSVTDNGIGIPTVYRERIFENFFRVPTGNIHNAKGFGLGLGYVAAIVKRHQGHIDVKSTVGEGTTFAITLPTGIHLKTTI